MISQVMSYLPIIGGEEIPCMFETEFFRDSKTFRITVNGVLEEMDADFEVVGGTSPRSFARIIPESIQWKPLTNFDAVVILHHTPDEGIESKGFFLAAFRDGKVVVTNPHDLSL